MPFADVALWYLSSPIADGCLVMATKSHHDACKMVLDTDMICSCSAYRADNIASQITMHQRLSGSTAAFANVILNLFVREGHAVQIRADDQPGPIIHLLLLSLCTFAFKSIVPG